MITHSFKGAAAASAAVMLLGLSAVSAAAPGDAQQVLRKDKLEFVNAGTEHFTGEVVMANLFAPQEPAASYGALVTFAPGAHTDWHIHDMGQKLIVTDGVGYTGYEDGTVERLLPGDVVVCPPGVKHWHGAAPDSSMSHVAISETKEGMGVTWLEKIPVDEYQALTSGK